MIDGKIKISLEESSISRSLEYGTISKSISKGAIKKLAIVFTEQTAPVQILWGDTVVFMGSTIITFND